jgi:hypothetical protein
MGLISKIIGVVYFIIALYIANSAFDLITMPGFILAIEMWIIAIGAVLIAVEAARLFLKRPSFGI